MLYLIINIIIIIIYAARIGDMLKHTKKRDRKRRKERF